MTWTQIAGTSFTQDKLEQPVFLNANSTEHPLGVGAIFIPSSAVPATRTTWGFAGLYQASIVPNSLPIVFCHETRYGLINQQTDIALATALDASKLQVNPDDSPNLYFWGVVFIIHKWMPSGTIAIVGEFE